MATVACNRQQVHLLAVQVEGWGMRSVTVALCAAFVWLGSGTAAHGENGWLELRLSGREAEPPSGTRIELSSNTLLGDRFVEAAGGAARFLSVPPGLRRLTVDAPGHHPFSTQVEIRQGEATRLEVTLEPRRWQVGVRVRVRFE